MAGDANFRPYVENGKRAVEALGYPTLIYDLGNLGFGKPFDGRVSTTKFQNIPCKPAVILDALKHISEQDYLVWLDADAIMKSRIDEICKDYDLGLTMRLKHEQDPRASTINAGIVFIRNTPQSKQFLQSWAKHADELNGDQWALNNLTKLTLDMMNQTVTCDNTRIHCFPCTTYNNFYFDDDQRQAKIIHYKSARYKKLYPF